MYIKVMEINDLAAQLFCQFDQDNKGFITKDELLLVTNEESPFSEGQISSIFNLLDKDEKGVITCSDFTNAFIELSNSNNNVDDVCQETDFNYDENPDNPDFKFSNTEYNIDYREYENHQNYTDSEKTLINEDVYLSTNNKSSENDEDNDADMIENMTDNYTSNSVNIHYDLEIDTLFGHEDLLQISSDVNRFQNNDMSPAGSAYTDEDLSDDNSSDDISIRERYLNNRNTLIPKKTAASSNKLNNGYFTDQEFSKQTSLPDLQIGEKDTQKNSISIRRWHSCDFENLPKINLCNTTFNKTCDSINELPDGKLNQDESCQCDNEIAAKTLYKNKTTGSSFSRSCSCLNQAEIKARYKPFSSHQKLNMLTEVDGNKLNEDSMQRSNSFSELRQSNKRLSVPSNYRKRNSDEYLRVNIDKDVLLPKIEDGFISPRDHDLEDWQSYLKRLHCVSLFGGNQSLRYIWQQLGAYQKDLLIPLEDFIKAVVQEHKTVYSKCQDIENTLHLKIEQHDKEINQLYEEFDRTTLRELDQFERKHVEREESIKAEFRQLLDFKEQAFQEHIKYTNELSSKLEHYESELSNLRDDKKKLEVQLRSVLSEQQVLLTESESVTQENESLRERLALSNENIREIQDYLSQVTKDYEKERKKHESVMRRFKDLLEEKEFLEISLTALSTENEELRNKKKVNEAILNEALPLSESVDEKLQVTPPDMCSSPLDKTQNSAHGLSLHEEMNALEYEMHMDPISSSINLNDSYQENENNFLEKTQEFDLIASTEDNLNEKDFTDGNRVFSPIEEIDISESKSGTRNALNEAELELQKNKTSTPIKNRREKFIDEKTSKDRKTKVSPIRFVSPMHTEFKVIFCGKIEVGKTSLIHRICLNKYTETREQTLQLDIYKKSIQVDNTTLNLSFWDTLGQERFDSLPNSYYRKSDVAVVTYDVTDSVSFGIAELTLDSIREYTHDNVLVFLLANKIDMSETRVVQCKHGEELAEKYDAIFMEASAKSSENISNFVSLVAKAILLQHEYVFIHNNFDRSVTSILKNKPDFDHMRKCC